MPAGKNKINLLPQEEFEATTLGRILKWALSTFRVMVITMEMVVMLAFLSRFWLDARSNDLNDLIKNKSAIISAQANFEKDWRNTQKRLTIFSSLTSQEVSKAELLESIGNFLPISISLTNFSETEAGYQIKGLSTSEIGIAQLMANLEASKKFKEISLFNLDSSSQNKSYLTFTLKMKLAATGKETR